MTNNTSKYSFAAFKNGIGNRMINKVSAMYSAHATKPMVETTKDIMSTVYDVCKKRAVPIAVITVSATVGVTMAGSMIGACVMSGVVAVGITTTINALIAKRNKQSMDYRASVISCIDTIATAMLLPLIMPYVSLMMIIVLDLVATYVLTSLNTSLARMLSTTTVA